MAKSVSEEALKLAEIRQRIDSIDTKIVTLLNQRAQCAMDVAEVKLAARDDPNEPVVFYRPEREAQVIRQTMANNHGPLQDAQVAHLIREIMSTCLSLEETLNVAYLGPEGTFSQAAAIKQFGAAAQTTPSVTIDAVFDAVMSGECRYGIVPIENSTEGVVNATLDCLAKTRLSICGEVELPIRLHLLTQANVTLADVTKVYAHQHALAQARGWLDSHLPNVPRIAVSSNGEAALMAERDGTVAAIAGDIALQTYQVQKLAATIEDLHDNTTRFVVIGAEPVPASGNDKTCLMVSARNEAGALHRLLEPFSAAGISMTRLSSRPSRTEVWAYVFFVEFEGHADDPVVAEIIHSLEQGAFTIKHLGSFPAAAF